MTVETGATVLITGVHGQDGGYLADRLLGQGARVHGLVREDSQAARVQAAHPGLVAHVGDLRDDRLMRDLVRDLAPDSVFNLAGSTSVARSWEAPVETADVLAVAPVRLLDACWSLDQERGHRTRIVQASSAEIFGDAPLAPQHEGTPLAPVTPYGAAKAYAHTMVEVYRRRGMHASSAILYNHESPRRPTSFVARKISRGVAAVSLGQQSELRLGNIDALRDWGYAPDYVDALLRIAAHDEPGDYIVATGVARSVRDFVVAAFRHVGIEDWERFVVIDPHLYRPADPRALVGDPSRLRSLGWSATVDFEQLVTLMVDADLVDLRSLPESVR
jgi:GDPmannose 4,6-dehydratase